MFFCLICEQVGCSTPPPPLMQRKWNACENHVYCAATQPLCSTKIQNTNTMYNVARGGTHYHRQPASSHLLSPGMVLFFFRFFCLSGFWAQFCILGAFQLRAGSCLIVVIWLDIIFIVCQIIMMIIYETECLKRFPPAWEPNGQNNQPRRAFATQLWTSSHFYWLIFTSCGCFIVHLTTTGCNF